MENEKHPSPSATERLFDPDRIKVGGSLQSIVKASGGRDERFGNVERKDAFILNVEGQRFLYIRLQQQGQLRNDGFSTGKVRTMLKLDKNHQGMQVDHVASAAIEGGRMGNQYSLVALIPREVNGSHGATSEKGGAPLREFNKAAAVEDLGSPWTVEMMRKAACHKSDGSDHGLLRAAPEAADLRRASLSLLQGPDMQQRLGELAREGKVHDRLKANEKTNE